MSKPFTQEFMLGIVQQFFALKDSSAFDAASYLPMVEKITDGMLVIEVEDVTDHRQMLAMDLAKVEDTSLSPAQRKHWNEMEAKQAAREKLAKDAQDKALQERAEQMAQAGEVLSREYGSLNDHRMGAGHE